MTDYELEYQRSEAACGDPFPEFVELFEALPVASTVLDLGGGQGRDTLVAARLGHKVVAVDISPTGIGQILVAAQRENLSIEGVVTDLTKYCPNGKYDVVVLDRIVHMLKDIKDKVALLSKTAQTAAKSGYALVADTPSNQEHIERQFGDRRSSMNIGSTTACFSRPALLLWLALILLLPNSAWGQEGPGEKNRSEPVLLWHKASALFPIRVHLPEGFDSTKTYPAVIALHGYGSSSEQFERVGRAFAQAGFPTVVPEGPYPVPWDDSTRHSTWELSTWLSDLGVGPNLTDEPAIEARSIRITAFEFLPSVIDRIQGQYRVGSFYAFGFSLGGVYALGGGFYNRDRFEGIIAFGIGSGIDRELFTMRGSSLEDGSHLKVRLVLGRSDRLVPFSEAERLRDLLKTAGYDVTLDAFDGGHVVPDDALKRAVTWLNDLTNRP